MEILLSEEWKDTQKAARKFALSEFPDKAEELDREESFPFEIWKKACKLGFVGIWIEQSYGGPGLGFMEIALIMEEFWRVGPGCAQILSTAFGSELIQHRGSERQKRT
jgi:acyl-CoA dehydrogenase